MKQLKILLGVIITALSLMVALTVEAQDLSLIQTYLTPAHGYIVELTPRGVIVNLDASDGLQVGDLLVVNRPGKPLIHPATKEVIGHSDGTRSVLEVTGIKKGYSFAQPIEGREELASGQAVQSFAGLSAKLVAEGEANAMYRELRHLLPELSWQGLVIKEPTQDALPTTDLVFQWSSGQLKVLSSQGKLLRSFDLDSDDTAIAKKAAGVGAEPPPRLSLTRSEVPSVHSVVERLEERALMGAYVDTGHGGLLATVDGLEVRIYGADQGLRLNERFRTASGGNPVALTWWAPDNSSQPYLVVTSVVQDERDFGQVVETSLASDIYTVTPHLTPVAQGLHYFMGGFDRDADGRPELLLGQELDWRITFGRVFKLDLNAGEVTRSAVPFALPKSFTVTGSAMADLTGDGQSEVVMVQHGILTIHDGDNLLYKSASDMGGSLARFSFDRNPGQADPMTATAILEVPPVVADMDGDGQREVLAVSSDRSSFTVPTMGPSGNLHWISQVKLTEEGFRRVRLAGELENSVQALWLRDGRLNVLETVTLSGLKQTGYSQFVSIDTL